MREDVFDYPAALPVVTQKIASRLPLGGRKGKIKGSAPDQLIGAQQQPPDPSIWLTKASGEPHAKSSAGLLSRVQHLSALARIESHRLLDQNVKTSTQALGNCSGVGSGRGKDQDGVETLSPGECGGGLVEFRRLGPPMGPLEPSRVAIASGGQLDPWHPIDRREVKPLEYSAAAKYAQADGRYHAGAATSPAGAREVERCSAISYAASCRAAIAGQLNRSCARRAARAPSSSA